MVSVARRFRTNVFGSIVSKRNHQIRSKRHHLGIKHRLKQFPVLPLMRTDKIYPAAASLQYIIREKLPAVCQIDTGTALLDQSFNKPKQHRILTLNITIVCAVEPKWR